MKKKNTKKKKLKHRSHFVIMMYNNYVYVITHKRIQKKTEIYRNYSRTGGIIVLLLLLLLAKFSSYRETPSNPSNNFKVK